MNIIEIEDLRWLHEDYEHEIGLRSVQSGFESKMGGVWNASRPSEISGQAMAAAAKSRRILDTLSKIPKTHQITLHLAYGSRNWRDSDLKQYGKRLVGVAVKRTRSNVTNPGERKILAAIMVNAASVAYLRKARER